MSDQILIAKKELTVKAKDGQSACKMEGKGRLKGFVTMAICCTTPLLLVGAIALFGISLGALASGNKKSLEWIVMSISWCERRPRREKPPSRP